LLVIQGPGDAGKIAALAPVHRNEKAVVRHGTEPLQGVTRGMLCDQQVRGKKDTPCPLTS
jgi:hypothetical protein